MGYGAIREADALDDMYDDLGQSETGHLRWDHFGLRGD